MTVYTVHPNLHWTKISDIRDVMLCIPYLQYMVIQLDVFFKPSKTRYDTLAKIPYRQGINSRLTFSLQRSIRHHRVKTYSNV